MARLPDLDSLGARPVPVSRARVTSTPGVGAIGAAVSGLGEQLYRTGQQQFEKQDKLAFAAARTAVLKADVETRAALEQDQDWTTYESRYTDQMKSARDEARKLIRNSSDRAMFDAETDLDFERGRADVLRSANGKRVQSRLATTETALDQLHDTGLSALDEPTRAAVIANAGEIFESAVSDGLMTPQEAGQRRREWVSNYLSEQISSALLGEDPDRALAIYDANADKLDWRDRLSLQGNIKRAVDGRIAADDALRSAPGYVPVDAPEQSVSVGSMLSAIRSIESNNAHHNADGTVKTSSAGAVGIMQVMPSTGPEAAKMAGLPWDENKFRNDPAYNKALGEAYFNAMLDKFGDPVVAAAAYNAGPGAVDKALKRGGNWLSSLPAETQDYVAKFQQRTGAQQSARRWDKESWYANIDAIAEAEDWTIERRERAKEYADRQIARDEQLFARRENEADRQAQEIILSKRDGFTNVNAIPRSVWNNMSASMRAQALETAERNSAPKAPEANSATAMGLNVLQYTDAERFKNMDLSQYIGKVTPAEFESLLVAQAKLRNPDKKEVSVRSNITSAISFHTKLDKDLDRELDAERNPEAFMKVYQDMERYVLSVTGGTRDPTDKELDEAFNRATMKVVVEGGGWFGSDTEKRRFELDGGETYRVENIPDAVRQRISASMQKNLGRAPSDAELARIYVKFKGQKGYW